MRILPVAFLALAILAAGMWVWWVGPDAFPSRVAAVPPSNASANDNVNAAPVPAPVAPEGLIVVRTTSDSATLTWNDDPTSVSYRLFRNGTAIAQLTERRFLDIGLAPSTDYTYTVAGVGLDGTVSDPSVGVPARTAAVATSTPSGTTTTPKPAPSPNPSPSPTPTPAPTPAPSACGNGGACTASQVASHSTRSNCWVYLSPINKVYNITAYVRNPGQHPGGDVIAPFCGQNIYAYFIGSAGGHAHSSRALNSVLGAFYIGPFQP